MMSITQAGDEKSLPAIETLGSDLLTITPWQRWFTIILPFLAMLGYVVTAYQGGVVGWTLALCCIMVLSFVTYGSTSHDLVHRNLGLPASVNDGLLRLIEMLSMRSGAAYQLTHHYHHAHLLEPDDAEGSVAYGSAMNALLAGPLMQFRLFAWAWHRYPKQRGKLLTDALGIIIMLIASCILVPWTVAPLVYCGLVIAGSWLFPIITVIIPHDHRGTTRLTQTRYFRGWLVRLLAVDHLYHLEHHLYPMVPHHHWKRLADRLDPYFRRFDLKPSYLFQKPPQTDSRSI